MPAIDSSLVLPLAALAVIAVGLFTIGALNTGVVIFLGGLAGMFGDSALRGPTSAPPLLYSLVGYAPSARTWFGVIAAVCGLFAANLVRTSVTGPKPGAGINVPPPAPKRGIWGR